MTWHRLRERHAHRLAGIATADNEELFSFETNAAGDYTAHSLWPDNVAAAREAGIESFGDATPLLRAELAKNARTELIACWLRKDELRLAEPPC